MSAELRHFLLTVRAAPECRPRTSAEQRRSEAAEPVPHLTQRMSPRHLGSGSSPVSNQASARENTQRSCTGAMVLAVEEPGYCVHDQHAERRSLHRRRFCHDQASTPSTTELACALDLQSRSLTLALSSCRAWHPHAHAFAARCARLRPVQLVRTMHCAPPCSPLRVSRD